MREPTSNLEFDPFEMDWPWPGMGPNVPHTTFELPVDAECEGSRPPDAGPIDSG